MNVDDTQVRKDMSIIGCRGKPKRGYSVFELRKAIGDFLGINYENTAILIGAGRLGSALAEYPGFPEYGLRLAAVFDNDPERIGQVRRREASEREGGGPISESRRPRM